MQPKYPVSFPTSLGKESKIVYSLEELNHLIQTWDGIKQCLIYLYDFEEWGNSGPIFESVIGDRIVLVFDNPTEAKSWYSEYSITARLFEDGNRYYLVIFGFPGSTEGIKATIATVDEQICYPGTLNLKKGTRCVELSEEDISVIGT